MRRSLVVFLLCGICAPLGAQSVDVGYQYARSNTEDARGMHGLGARVRFSPPIDLRYDYVSASNQRLGSFCGVFAPPSCPGPEETEFKTKLQTFSVAARLRVLSHGSFTLFALPEIGWMMNTIERRGLTTLTMTSAHSDAPALGLGLELAATRIGGSAFGGWLGARFRAFAISHPTVPALGSNPYSNLDRLGSLELGVSYGF